MASGTVHEGGSMASSEGSLVPRCAALYSMAEVAVDLHRVMVLAGRARRIAGRRSMTRIDCALLRSKNDGNR